MASCPKCHRQTYSKKWGSCTACDSVGDFNVGEPAGIRMYSDSGKPTPPADNSVLFHVEQHAITRRKDGLCPRCDERPKGLSGYCPECHAARAREARAIHSSGRPSGRPRKQARA